MEGWKDGSPRRMEGWDGPSRPPYKRRNAAPPFSLRVRVMEFTHWLGGVVSTKMCARRVSYRRTAPGVP